MVNVALLFAVAAVAVTLVVTPMVSDPSGSAQMASTSSSVDSMSTGSITSSGEPGKRYTIRRSVLQDTPGAVCIVGASAADGGC
ncbi:hypothetical protein FB480_104396 [Agrobacterium vitis]|nr:hypothetical protein FB480_104396 [Agrobacterium vitis]